MLYFLLLYISANSQLLYLYVAAASCHCFCSMPLTYCVRYAVQYTVAASTIPCPIRWSGRFFVVCSFPWDWDRSIEAAVVVMLSRTPLNFPSQYACDFTIVYLFPSYSLSHFSSVILIIHRLHNQESLFLYPLYHLYATYLMLYQSPCVSTSVSSAILVRHPWHLVCLIPL